MLAETATSGSIRLAPDVTPRAFIADAQQLRCRTLADGRRNPRAPVVAGVRSPELRRHRRSEVSPEQWRQRYKHQEFRLDPLRKTSDVTV